MQTTEGETCMVRFQEEQGWSIGMELDRHQQMVDKITEAKRKGEGHPV